MALVSPLFFMEGGGWGAGWVFLVILIGLFWCSVFLVKKNSVTWNKTSTFYLNILFDETSSLIKERAISLFLPFQVIAFHYFGKQKKKIIKKKYSLYSKKKLYAKTVRLKQKTTQQFSSVSFNACSLSWLINLYYVWCWIFWSLQKEKSQRRLVTFNVYQQFIYCQHPYKEAIEFIPPLENYLLRCSVQWIMLQNCKIGHRYQFHRILLIWFDFS